MTGIVPKLPASLAILLISGALGAIFPVSALAQRARTVVIVDAAGSEPARRAVSAAVAANPRLTRLAPTGVTRALVSESPEVDGEVLGPVAERLEAADDAIARFDFDKALIQLFRAERPLIDAVPDAEVRRALSDINFRLGLIYLQQGERDRARVALGAVHFLTPDTELDPARYPPDVVGGFERARPGPPDSTLAITASVDGAAVFVDGRPVGVAPVEVPVPAGAHYVLIRKADHRPAGRRVETQAGDVEPVRIPLAMLPPETLAASLRHTLSRRSSQLATDIERTGRRAIALTSAGAAIVIIERPGMGPIGHAVTEERVYPGHRLPERAQELVRELSPPPPPPVEIPPPTVTDTPWFREPWALATLGGALVTASIVTAVLLAGGDDMRESGGICFPPEC